MIKKRQIVAMVSIAVASFLVGTTFNALTMAKDGGSPWDRVWTAIFGLESRIETLEEQSPPQQGFLTAPAYDSGWFSIEPNETVVLEHDLSTTEVFLYMIGKNSAGGIHQFKYGFDNTGKWWTGCYWYNLTENSMKVYRARDDGIPNPVNTWEEARVMIWKTQPPPT